MATLFNADEVWQIAVEIEQNGANFYRTAARLASNREAATLLADLAEWEKGHVAAFADLRARLDASARQQTPTGDPSEVAEYLKALADSHVFRRDAGLMSLLSHCPGVVEMLQLAMRLENESIALYETMLRLVPANLGQAEVGKLLSEERQHLAMLRGKVHALTGQP
jgi:rubrerythrin